MNEPAVIVAGAVLAIVFGTPAALMACVIGDVGRLGIKLLWKRR